MIPGLERSPGEGNGYPLQYSYPENLMDRGAWWAIVHGVIKSQCCVSGIKTIQLYIYIICIYIYIYILYIYNILHNYILIYIIYIIFYITIYSFSDLFLF